MRVYVACPWKHKHAAVATAQLLRAEGHEVTSRWHDIASNSVDSSGHDAPFEVCKQEAYNDITDVMLADIVLVLNIERSEGKAVEQGIAIARGIPILLVGTRSNVFHYVDSVTVVSTYAEALTRLKSYPVWSFFDRSAPSDSISACDR